jgi:hypothetical protein
MALTIAGTQYRGPSCPCQHLMPASDLSAILRCLAESTGTSLPAKTRAPRLPSARDCGEGWRRFYSKARRPNEGRFGSADRV